MFPTSAQINSLPADRIASQLEFSQSWKCRRRTRNWEILNGWNDGTSKSFLSCCSVTSFETRKCWRYWGRLAVWSTSRAALLHNWFNCGAFTSHRITERKLPKHPKTTVNWVCIFSPNNSIKLHFNHNPRNWIKSSSKSDREEHSKTVTLRSIPASLFAVEKAFGKIFTYKQLPSELRKIWFSLSQSGIISAELRPTQETLESFTSCNVTRRKVSLDCDAIPSSP